MRSPLSGLVFHRPVNSSLNFSQISSIVCSHEAFVLIHLPGTECQLSKPSQNNARTFSFYSPLQIARGEAFRLSTIYFSYINSLTGKGTL